MLVRGLLRLYQPDRLKAEQPAALPLRLKQPERAGDRSGQRGQDKYYTYGAPEYTQGFF